VLHKVGKQHPWKKLKKKYIYILTTSAAKSKHQDHSELVSSWGFKHSDLEMPGKVNSENDMLEMHYMEITKLHSSTAVSVF
jgi:hypothetical protein